MPPLAPWPLLLLWAALVLQAWFCVGLAWRYLGIFDSSARHDDGRYTPHATVIVPCKGVDAGLSSGVAGLCEQQYPDYELVFVVESRDDPAYEVIRLELARHPHRKAQVLVAGVASKTEGQKVHNQLFALNRIHDTSGDTEVWVFADSDAVPGPNWLRNLIGPLKQYNRTAVTTGYRWLIPQEPASFWSRVASVMNSSVAGLMGKDTRNHAWGGSMAIRADIARRGDLRGKLAGALCDDYQFTRLATALGLRVYFVPRCLVGTPVHFDRAGFVNFVHRQYLLTRVYSPLLFAKALAITSLYAAGIVSLVIYLVMCIIRGWAGTPWIWPFAGLLLVMSAEQVRSLLRRRVVRRAFGDEMLDRLRATLLLDRWATPVWMLLHWFLIIRSAFGRKMRWRGILYRLEGPQKCERLD